MAQKNVNDAQFRKCVSVFRFQWRKLIEPVLSIPVSVFFLFHASSKFKIFIFCCSLTFFQLTLASVSDCKC